jgi:hypothetical protein
MKRVGFAGVEPPDVIAVSQCQFGKFGIEFGGAGTSR